MPIKPPRSYGKPCDMCQAHAAAWIQERRYPEPEEGIVDINFCFAWESDECYAKNKGKIVACIDKDGPFYLYFLNPTPSCYYAYCT